MRNSFANTAALTASKNSTVNRSLPDDRAVHELTIEPRSQFVEHVLSNHLLNLGRRQAMRVEKTFCMLKTETYLLRKMHDIEHYIGTSGLEIIEIWKIHLGFRDVYTLYPDWIPRITMTLRFLPLLYLDVFIVQGPGAIHRMLAVKHQLRQAMWGVTAGGFVHTPDSTGECRDHMAILQGRRVA